MFEEKLILEKRGRKMSHSRETCGLVSSDTYAENGPAGRTSGWTVTTTWTDWSGSRLLDDGDTDSRPAASLQSNHQQTGSPVKLQQTPSLLAAFSSTVCQSERKV